VHIVTRDEYERSKGRLEEQRHAGIELIETAYQAQVRALDLVWMLQGEGAGGERVTLASPEPAAPALAQQEPLPPAEPPRYRMPIEIQEDVRAIFPRLPERFTRRDVCQLLGYEPGRAALYRYLRDLVAKGVTRVEESGDGRRATVYRKISADGSPAPG
jgi:hypothetical protein